MTIKDVRRVQRRMQRAILALAELVDAEQDADALAALFAAMDRPPDGFMQQLATVRDALAFKIHLVIVDDPNRRRLFPGYGTLEASWSGGATWDGKTILARLVALTVDEAYVDKTTGEVRPPAAFAAYLANEIAACAGLDSGSREWRKTELRGRGIEPNDHIERHPNPRKTVRWK